MPEAPTDKVFQDSKTFPGHGMCLVKMYDAKDKKHTIVNIKAQGEELIWEMDPSNEEDVCAKFKVKRVTKEFCKHIFDRVKIAFKDGKLAIEFDWTDITRIQIEAGIRAQNLANLKAKNEEERVLKEKQRAEQKIADEKAKLAEEQRKKEEERRRLDAIALAKQKEEEAKHEEERKERKKFEDKIMGAMMGAAPVKPKHENTNSATLEDPEADPLYDPNISETYSEECGASYYTDLTTYDVYWRHPKIQSVWEKQWVKVENKFSYTNKTTKEVVWEAPWLKKFDKVWVPERNKFVYVHIESGDVQDREPYY